jgi:hypothetical protein
MYLKKTSFPVALFVFGLISFSTRAAGTESCTTQNLNQAPIVAASSITPYGATLGFSNLLNGATALRVEFKEHGAASYAPLSSGLPTASKIFSDSAKFITLHTYDVRARVEENNGRNCSAWSAAVSFTTTDACPNPPSPLQQPYVTLSSKSSDTVKLNFSHVLNTTGTTVAIEYKLHSAPASAYKLLADNISPTTATSYFGGVGTSFFAANQTYDIRARVQQNNAMACSKWGGGPQQTNLVVTTIDCSNGSGNVGSLGGLNEYANTSGLYPNYCRANWVCKNGCLARYKDSGATSNSITVPIIRFQCKFTSPTKGRGYAFYQSLDQTNSANNAETVLHDAFDNLCTKDTHGVVGCDWGLASGTTAIPVGVLQPSKLPSNIQLCH